MRRRRQTTVLALGLVVGVGVSLFGLWWALPGERDGADERGSRGRALPPAPPARGAFVTGGTPDHPAAAEALFAEVLPDYLIALDGQARSAPAGESGALEIAEQKLREALLRSDLPAPVVEAIEELGAAARAAALAETSELDEVARALQVAARRTNDALASAGIGFYVDPEVLQGKSDLRQVVVMFSFLVDRVVVYRTADVELRSLEVRRLDRLNWRYSLLGYSSPQQRAAVVLLDRIDEQLASLLTALGTTEAGFDPFELDDTGRGRPWRRRAEARAREVIRAELGAGEDAASAQRLGDHLARRQALYDRWNTRLEARGVLLAPPGFDPLPAELRAELLEIASAEELEHLDEIDAVLAADEVLAAYDRRRDWLAESVGQHELQHRFDMIRAEPLPQPDALASWVGEPDDDPNNNDTAEVARAELSAYLAQLARHPRLPRTTLTLLFRYFFDDRSWGTGESYAALVIASELANELELDRAPLVVAREIDREAAASLYDELSRASADDLRAAAASSWRRLFGRPLPEPRLVGPRPR